MRRFPRYLTTLVVAMVVVGAGTIVTGLTSRGQATTSSLRGASGFLLSMGGSGSRGMQPVGTSDGIEMYTRDQYSSIIGQIERRRGFPLLVRRLGCPGATLGALLGTSTPLRSDTCYQPPRTQLTTAEDFLRVHHSDPGVVTMEFGMNLLRPCFIQPVTNQRCAEAALADVTTNLPRLITHLQRAAGPRTSLIGLNFPDPFIVYPKYARSEVVHASDSLKFVKLLNQELDRIYSQHHVAVADVAQGFQIDTTSPSPNPALRGVPVNVANACLLTWICLRVGSLGSDHLNRAGQIVVADSVMAVMPDPWRLNEMLVP